MMKRQTLIALGAALLLGILAVYLANSMLVRSDRAAFARGTTKVAVATAPLAFGTDITADRVRFVDYPNSSIPPGSFTTAAQLMPAGRKRVALIPIAVNEPILASKISGAGQGASIAALLPPGKRAASVRINDVSGVAGFIQPNDSVDVLITRQIPNADRDVQQTDVLLQNVRVIAIDQQAKNADGSPKIAKTATLEVTPLDSQKLALAQEVGSLSLVLRKPGEQDNPVVETVSMNDLRYNIYGGARYPAPAVVGSFSAAPAPAPRPARVAYRKPAPPPPSRPKVEIYRGTTGNQVEVGGNGR
ncbi:MAG TPA: Flp pilus assembly protein CpaB [Sphingomicrobium sp.]|nr:Flp pilus assembly protein CpaB [Sphingomicrobium sp.]